MLEIEARMTVEQTTLLGLQNELGNYAERYGLTHEHLPA
jgi:hypothetical protein